jgi:CRISPR-associated protein Csm4
LAKIGKVIPNDGDLGFTVSSLFPFYQENEDTSTVYFFPKPLKQILPDLKEVGNAKDIKSVAWLDSHCFKEVLNNKIFKKETIKGCYLTQAKIHTQKEEEDVINKKLQELPNEFIYPQVSPRVKVSRSGQGDAVPFYMDRIYFKDYSGLFFVVLGDDTSLLDAAMEVLQHEGIGTDRNVGNGFFTFEKDTKTIIDYPQESDYVMSLSMFIPESKEQLEEMISGDAVSYDFIRRGGWITTPPYNTYRKNAIYAFLPGSVFSLKASNPFVKGTIVDLKPELEFNGGIKHSIWRNGKSIFIPIKL